MSNSLAAEKSPYLRQHADNPVAWLPWGEAAFAQARAEQKPIFLSIGYSTCHWCHVMAHECFENADIAALLNAHFVAIKVDREERPDVDKVYMSYVQAMTGHGGWPLSAWLTPELKPFFGGTYFPPEDRHGRPGFPTLLRAIARGWETERDKLVAEGERALGTLREYYNRPAEAAGRLRHIGQSHHRRASQLAAGGLVVDVQKGLVAPDRCQHRQPGLDVHPHVAGVDRQREGLGRYQSVAELPVDQQRPHITEGHPVVDEVFDVDAAVPQRSAVLVRFGDLGGEGDDAFQARDEVVR